MNLNKLGSRSRLLDLGVGEIRGEGGDGSERWYISLNCEWRFLFLERPDDAPEGFTELGYDDSSWFPTTVPGNWQMQGYGRPHYTNIRMPFPQLPPRVPEENPTGLFRRRFALPAHWRDRRTVLHFGGVESVLAVWLNGVFVGLSKGSRLPAEFDVSALLREGENQLAAMVVQWSDASFVEDQDHWWLAGIFRETFLRSTPPVRIDDVFAEPILTPGLDKGELRLRVRIGAADRLEADWRVRARLLRPDGSEVWPEPWELGIDEASRDELRAWWQIDGRRPVLAPALWSHETPALHELRVELCEGDRVREATSLRVGFRRIEIRDRSLLINGRRVLIKGVNLHDHHERTGRAVPRETMETDVKLMKRLHFNAIRCSHYPADSYLYELCDRHGLYVIDEADIECHAFRKSLADDPRYAAAWLDRGMRMVQRDKNHACVIAWSLGNESGCGANHDALAGWIRRYDPSRLLHYEGATAEMNWAWSVTAPHRPDFFGLTDLICPMYPSLDKLIEFSGHAEEPRPCIACEFSHAMGNANGNLREYFELFETLPGLQGGFIWEWVDHGLVSRDANGKEFWAYGGDFGDEPNDANFVADGLVWPDRRPHPAALEFRKLAQPVAVEAVDLATARFRVRNKHDFVPLAGLHGTWRIEIEGEEAAGGDIAMVAVAPGETFEFALPAAARAELARRKGEAFVRFSFAAMAYGEVFARGEEIAWEQIQLRDREEVPTRCDDPASVAPSVAGTSLTSARLDLAVDSATGFWNRWRVDGSDWLHTAPRLNLWRCPTDNDGLRLLERTGGKPYHRWLEAGYDRLEMRLEHCGRIEVGGTAGFDVVQAGWLANERRVVHRIRWTLAGENRLRCESVVELDESLPDLPRIGMTLALAEGFETFEWFGRGPDETYGDRKAGGWIARFRSTVAEQFVPYLLPQEHGNRTDVRWFELGDERGRRIRFEARPRCECSVSHFTAQDLFAARHPHELSSRRETIVNFDAAQRGLGNGACGDDALLRYRIAPGRHRIDFDIVFG